MTMSNLLFYDLYYIFVKLYLNGFCILKIAHLCFQLPDHSLFINKIGHRFVWSIVLQARRGLLIILTMTT